MKPEKRIHETAEMILGDSPDPVVKHLILRDVLRLPKGDNELKSARRELSKSAHAMVLKSEQWKDGSWGRYHSKDSRAKQVVGTTEIGVQRAVSIGLDKADPILKKAADYSARVLMGKVEIHDLPEKNRIWPYGVGLFAASTLAWLDPPHPALKETNELWTEVVQRAFKSGKYNHPDCAKAYIDLLGIDVSDRYARIASKYHVPVLGCNAGGKLSRKLERLYSEWLWNLEGGLGYVEWPVNKLPSMKIREEIERWFMSQELFARFLPSWKSLARNEVEWLWSVQGNDGYWDFRTRVCEITNYVHHLPMSEDWMRKNRRKQDWSTRVLLLLGKFYE